MRRYAPFIALIGGVLLLGLIVPYITSSQPQGIRLTRDEARALADPEARRRGIPVDESWTTITWVGSPLLDQELEKDPARRRAAENDPAIGPRLGGYKVVYHRRGVDKGVPYGHVYLSGKTGEILSARLRRRAETAGANPTEAQLRPIAEQFVRSRSFPGAPSPQFESARPTMMRARTDWIFRYRVASTSPIQNVIPYLYVHFTGDQLTGWDLIEEYADGSIYRGGPTGELVGFFTRVIVTYGLLLLLLVVFLRKYHAGEVGVGTASLLFIAMAALFLTFDGMAHRSMAEGSQMGSLDAQSTAIVQAGFKFLFYDLPLSVLIFFAWAVGESFARERWGERLASFDAVLRRDPFNATVGRSVLRGLLTAPAVAAATLGAAALAVAFGIAHPAIGSGTQLILGFAGPLIAVVASTIDAIAVGVVAILLTLAFSFRRRMLGVGIVVALLLGVIVGATEAPIEPVLYRMIFGFGGVAAAIAIFMAYDLLTTAVALFAGFLLVNTLPLLTTSSGPLFRDLLLSTAVPVVALGAFAAGALLTKREIVYMYEDLAPHVKRIIERERVKAEIDAANRIQAALLPVDAPNVEGTSFASHYRAATEIGGDYFDFLPQRGGEIGIAFGDVSGHGLTSGIVMAMAKSALLVQLDYDPTPRAVLSVLNEIVMKTAPKRILMTFFFGLLDPRSQTLRFSSAGHLDPYVYRAATRQLEPLSSWGFPLGVRRREPFREVSVSFNQGDRLILYSDGLIEAVDDDGEPYGFERFERTLLDCGHQSAEEIKKSILAAVRKFTRNRPPEDDQTLVVVAFEEAMPAILTAPEYAAEVSETVH